MIGQSQLQPQRVVLKNSICVGKREREKERERERKREKEKDRESGWVGGSAGRQTDSKILG